MTRNHIPPLLCAALAGGLLSVQSTGAAPLLFCAQDMVGGRGDKKLDKLRLQLLQVFSRPCIYAHTAVSYFS